MNAMEHIRVSTKGFLKELEWIARFIEKRCTIPVIQNVLLDSRAFDNGDGQLWLTGTDLETAGQTMVETRGNDAFKVTIPVHSLLKYLKKVEESELTLVPVYQSRQEFIPADETDATVEGPQEMRIVAVCIGLNVRHGESEVTLQGIEASQYVELPSAPFDAIELTGLAAGIPRATLAISPEESRFTLNGALLEIHKGEAKLVATDGHRLSLVTLGTDQHKAAGMFRALIGKKALNEIARISDRCLISRDDNHVFITVGHRSILGRTLTGNFPDYERVLPKSADLAYCFQADSAKLLKAIERIQVFADERSHAMQFKVTTGTLTLSAGGPDSGSASGKLPVSWAEFDGAYCTSFNSAYVAEFVKAAKSDEVVFSFDNPVNAAQWSVENWKYVVMPMRGNEAERPYAERDRDARRVQAEQEQAAGVATVAA